MHAQGVYMAGGHAWLGPCMAGGVHGWGACVARGVRVLGVHGQCRVPE